MEININKYILLEALQLVVNLSPKATSEPIINNVLIETDENGSGIQLKATNYENEFLGKFEATVTSPGKICVNTSKLYNLVREFRGSEISLTSTPQNWVFLYCENSKVKLPGVDPEHFPVIEFKELKNRFQLPGKLFVTAIDRTYFAIGDNESRKNLMGLNLAIKSPTLINWTGADSFRISQFMTELESPIESDGNIIIPKKSLQEIKRIIDFGEEIIDLSFDENTFQISTRQVNFKTRLIEAEFPNLDGLLSNVGPYQLAVPKEELMNAVRILHTITEGEPNSVLKLTAQPEKVLLESQKLEFGEGNDEIECDFSGEQMSIGLNIRFLMESLQSFESSDDDRLIINISDQEAPFMVQCEGWKDFKTILMPVRIKW
jgi:DNA polymerase III subunit beta